ncbi:MAG: TIGR02281 family clan AA aspartic protease [Sphingomicrobium sp.]
MFDFLNQAGPEWQRIALYAVAAAVLLLVIQRIPVIGKLFRLTFSVALLAFCFYLLLQQAPFQPKLGRIASSLGLDTQEVSGKEVRIRLAPDGHFWANVTINGWKRRMLIDSGATVSGLSDETAQNAQVENESGLVPIVMQTANGIAQARPATVRELRVGNIVARNLKVVTSPGLGVDILGMNFLSKLKSWRVENNVLILTPHHPQDVGTE